MAAVVGRVAVLLFLILAVGHRADSQKLGGLNVCPLTRTTMYSLQAYDVTCGFGWGLRKCTNYRVVTGYRRIQLPMCCPGWLVQKTGAKDCDVSVGQRLEELEETVDGIRYRSIGTTTHYSTADEKCRENGGHLAKINLDLLSNSGSAPLDTFMSQLYAIQPVCYWIGMTDLAREGDWKWFDGSAVTSVRWGTGLMNTWFGHSKNDCGKLCRTKNQGLDYYWEWRDSICVVPQPRPFICQYAVINTATSGSRATSNRTAAGPPARPPPPPPPPPPPTTTTTATTTTASAASTGKPLSQYTLRGKLKIDGKLNPKLRATSNLQFPAFDRERCIRLCIGNPPCELVNHFSEAQGQCHLYSDEKLALEQGVDSEKGWSVWYVIEKV